MRLELCTRLAQLLHMWIALTGSQPRQDKSARWFQIGLGSCTIVIRLNSFQTVRPALKQSDDFKTFQVGNCSVTHTYVHVYAGMHVVVRVQM